jgi:hypothetical protein
LEIVIIHPVVFAGVPEDALERTLQSDGTVYETVSEYDVDHRIFRLPIPLVVYVEPFEQFLPPLEEAFDRIAQEGFAEAARTGEEVGGLDPGMDEIVYVSGLVYINGIRSFLSYGRKRLFADGELFHGGYYYSYRKAL